jgi:ribonuclease BN (tRNA processing enzyme)
VGWGHSTVQQAIAFAACAAVKHLLLFHHDPTHTDEDLERMVASAFNETTPSFPVTLGAEGRLFDLGSTGSPPLQA